MQKKIKTKRIQSLLTLFGMVQKNVSFRFGSQYLTSYAIKVAEIFAICSHINPMQDHVVKCEKKLYLFSLAQRTINGCFGVFFELLYGSKIL